MHMMAPEYEAEALRLREAPPQKYDFSKATLSDVLRFLATDANISFFSLPDDSADGGKLITFSIEASPFRVLETLCKANGLAIIPDNGIWYIRPADDRELIGKSYNIKHNALERVDYTSSGNALSGSPAAGAGGGGSAGVSLQGTNRSFNIRRSELINSIRDLLGLPPENLEGGAAGAGAPIGGQGQDSVRDMNSNTLSATRQPKVIWQSDSNTLYIVATRLQHMWVEGYLLSADQPQQLIAIEVKFIETSRDPKREFGIDWTGTLETGNFRRVDKTTTSTDAAGNERINVEYSNQPTTGGFRADLAPLLSGVNLNNVGATLGWPALSVLSAQDLNVKLRAIMRDDETNTTSYPRMVTLNNREVAIRSVVNQPVLDSSSSSAGGGGGAAVATTQVAYLPIGTVLNIHPKKMAEEKVLLNMDITVSSIIGETVISGNPYPVASSRVYNAPVEVHSGYTVAVGGLDEAREREGEAGVPFLEKVPGLKWLFKYKSRSKNHKNLMLFITPNLIDARDGGLPAEPQSVVPQRPSRYLPTKPRVDYHTGALANGPADLPNASRYLSRETDKLENLVNENLITEETGQKLRELKVATEQLVEQCQQLKLTHPGDFAVIDQNELVLKGVLDRIGRVTRTMFTKKYF
jgi:type II secretory pathway component GspD/PulD (secretin)